MLVPVVKLVGHPGIARAEDIAKVTYHHILCARHEIVLADGAWCETLLPGAQVASIPGPQAWAEIVAHLPDGRPDAAARPILTGPRCRRLLERHARNQKSLFQPVG